MGSRNLDRSASHRPSLCQSSPTSKRDRKRCWHCHREHKKCEYPDLRSPCQRCTDRRRECSLTEPLETGNSTTMSGFGTAARSPTYNTPSYNNFSEEQRWNNSNLDTSTLFSGSSSGSMSGIEADNNQPRYGGATYLAVEAFLQKARSDCQKHLDKITPLPRASNYSPSICEDLADHAQRTKAKITEIEFLELRSKSSHFSQLIEDQTRTRNNLPTMAASDFNMTDDGIEHLVLACVRNSFSKRRKCLPQPSWEDYVIIEHRLRALISRVEPTYRGNVFPAFHIAYLNGDIKSMLNLWIQRLEYRRDGDILGRKLPHLLVEANDMNTLGRLLEVDKDAVTHAGIDDRGLSLLSLAAVAGKLDIFNQLMNRHAAPLTPKDNSQFLLDLALVGGAKNLVEYIVPQDQHCYSLVQPPYDRATRKCIELDRADLAECFTRWLEQSCWHGPDEIHKLADLANRKNDRKMQEFACVLQRILVKSGALQEASEDATNVDERFQKRTDAQQTAVSPFSQPANISPGRSWAQVAACQTNSEQPSILRQQSKNSRRSSSTSQYQTRAVLNSRFVLSQNPSVNEETLSGGHVYLANDPWPARREAETNRGITKR